MQANEGEKEGFLTPVGEWDWRKYWEELNLNWVLKDEQ